MPLEIDDDLRAFLESGVAAVVGTRDAALAPEVCRAWGIRVLGDRRTLQMCVGLPSAERSLRNLEQNGRVALTCVLPLVYRQVQLKGTFLERDDATDEDRAWAERHQAAFARSVEPLGIGPELCRGFWTHDAGLARVRFAVEEAFDQTPGPDAGRRL